jgi:hypothetical protein
VVLDISALVNGMARHRKALCGIDANQLTASFATG